jgi:hypothetical protein
VLAKKDPTGHCVALVLLRSDEDDRSEVAEFNLPFLPGDLDAFVRELEAMREVVGRRRSCARNHESDLSRAVQPVLFHGRKHCCA